MFIESIIETHLYFTTEISGPDISQSALYMCVLFYKQVLYTTSVVNLNICITYLHIMSGGRIYMSIEVHWLYFGFFFPVGRLVCFEFLTRNEKIVCMTISKAIGRIFVSNGRTIDVRISPIG